jgi:2-amino-4-hydroxy-6-hydroxymethyldihydropteridine diphosphokinase
MKNRAYLSLGSNIDPERNIEAALKRLADHGPVLAVSTIWETAPVGFTAQANFLNGAVVIETELSAAELKHQVLRSIEDELGRVRDAANKNGPRTIDLDIILFNEAVLEVDGKPIPSPELLERAFVALPLAEIAPDYVHPLTGDTLQTLAGRFAAAQAVMQPRDDLNPTLSTYLRVG